MPELVAFQQVSKKFGSKSPLDKVSFSLKKASLTTLIGPNGAGKTTIAKLMLGLEQPTSGRIITTPNLKVGYVPQKLNFSSAMPISVKNFLELLAPNLLSLKHQALIDFSDFDNLKNHDISTLSGGQFQKLLLSASLLNEPDLLILDEPTQSLDAAGQQEFYRLINQIKHDLQMTIFMISHDLFTVMRNADQVICLNRHVCCSGHPHNLTNDQDFVNALSEIGFYVHHHDHKH